MRDFFSLIKRHLVENRLNTLLVVSCVISAVLFVRLFSLQIVKGADYQDNYRLKIEKHEVIDATRGNIYDRNGNPLAYNKLVNAVVIEDVGTYKNETERNETINRDLEDIVKKLLFFGDDIYIDFGIVINSQNEYQFNLEGTRLNRFRADIFGRQTIADLRFNSRYDIDEANATADEIMNYLCDIRYGISPELPKEIRYYIATIRYRIGLNSYQKYISTTIASDISKEAVAYIMENKYKYTGVDVEEQSIRVYDNAECFSNILGYTGTISYEEYEELSKEDDGYSLNDVIGKSGIEQYMNSELMGKKGYQTVFVDSLGNLLETADMVEQESGNDVYLSIDKDLTIKTYNLLEQQIAGILHSKIVNMKQTDNRVGSDDIIIPVYDVYYALISNRVLNVTKTENLSESESRVFAGFEVKYREAIDSFGSYLLQTQSVPYNALPPAEQEYSTYLVKKLKAEGILNEELIDARDEMQNLWTSEQLAVSDYLKYSIEMGWIDISKLIKENEYVDTSEVYSKLIGYSVTQLENDNEFKRLVYYYALIEDRIDLGALMAMLFDQGVIAMDEPARESLLRGTLAPYNFIKEKIRRIEITPGQLGLDPCSGSCVVLEPNTGEVLALVTYPGYDSNRLANNLDTAYYAYLNSNNSSPLYNHATQERTAPGSTYKLVSSTAGLAEGVTDIYEKMETHGLFNKVSNEPRCWIYPGNHGTINMAEAIRDSCNYYFYEIGYRLAGDTNYSDPRGIARLTTYADLFGLTERTGIEIEESQPSAATEFPVMAAIGQSDNNFTTIALARYVSAVANSGNVFNLTLLSKVCDKDNNVLREFAPSLKNRVEVLDASGWNTLRSGMRMVVESSAAFADSNINAAGKTGTAQQVATRPNHALFVGYAPFDAPKVAVACRISFGYTSGNAAALARRVMEEALGAANHDQGEAASNISTTNRITD